VAVEHRLPWDAGYIEDTGCFREKGIVGTMAPWRLKVLHEKESVHRDRRGAEYYVRKS
jgi:hypothetical protein